MLVAACHESLSPSYVAASHKVCVCISPSVTCHHLPSASGLDRVAVVVLRRRSSSDTYGNKIIWRPANERARSILQPS